MLANVFCFGINGLDAYVVTIETDISLGLPTFTIVGLGDTAVKESRERVRTAIKHCGIDFPEDRITVNLAPADTKKQGPSYDAAIAISILAAAQVIASDKLKDLGIIGELSLNGDLKPVTGALAIALACKDYGLKSLILPHANASEAALVEGLDVYPAKHLSDIINWLSPQQDLPAPWAKPDTTTHAIAIPLDFADVKGQLAVKRGLEIAAAGGHNVLIIGPPGSGKTMLARRLAGILPPLTLSESLEVTRIHSVAAKSTVHGLITQRPVRSPHHTASNIALIGGGSIPMPGEVTLAHHGILFLDELPEFSRQVLETLRQPLEDGYVNIARAKASCLFPARIMLVCAMNPCPCGFRSDPTRACKCTPLMIERYQQKISGPLLDRIDIHLHAPALSADELLSSSQGESSAAIRARTVSARLLQTERFSTTKIDCNAHMQTHELRTFCSLNPACQKILSAAIKHMHLSARANDKIIKVARTIADLANEKHISPTHIAEAISYRPLDRMS